MDSLIERAGGSEVLYIAVEKASEKLREGKFSQFKSGATCARLNCELKSFVMSAIISADDQTAQELCNICIKLKLTDKEFKEAISYILEVLSLSNISDEVVAEIRLILLCRKHDIVS